MSANNPNPATGAAANASGKTGSGTPPPPPTAPQVEIDAINARLKTIEQTLGKATLDDSNKKVITDNLQAVRDEADRFVIQYSGTDVSSFRAEADKLEAMFASKTNAPAGNNTGGQSTTGTPPGGGANPAPGSGSGNQPQTGGTAGSGNQPSAGGTTNHAIIPGDVSKQIWSMIDAAEDAIDDPDLDTEKVVRAAIRDANRVLARSKDLYKASEDEFRIMETAIQGLVDDLAAWKKREEEKAGHEKSNKKDEGAGKNLAFNFLNWIRKHWPLVLMLLALLGLIWYTVNNNGIPETVSSLFKRHPAVQNANDHSRGSVTGQTYTNSLLNGTGTQFNTAERIRVRNSVKGDIIGDNNIVGNGQVAIHMVTNTYNYYYGVQAPNPAPRARPPQAPAPAPQTVKSNYFWTIHMTPGQVYSREISDPINWKLDMDITSRLHDLKVELQSADGAWHTMRNDTDSREPYAKAVRLTASPQADEITVRFELKPRN